MEFHLIFGHVSSSRNQQELFRHPRADSGKKSLPTLRFQNWFTVTWLVQIYSNMNQPKQPVTPEVWPKRIYPWRFLKGYHSSRGYPTWQDQYHDHARNIACSHSEYAYWSIDLFIHPPLPIISTFSFASSVSLHLWIIHLRIIFNLSISNYSLIWLSCNHRSLSIDHFNLWLSLTIHLQYQFLLIIIYLSLSVHHYRSVVIYLASFYRYPPVNVCLSAWLAVCR